MIVTGAGGYMAGTYLSTAAITGLVATATGTAAGLGATAVAVLSGAGSSIIGSAGVAATTVEATGLKALLMSIGITPSSAVIAFLLPAVGCIAAGAGFYYWWRFMRKPKSATSDQEALFTEMEARIVERLVKKIGKTERPDADVRA
ncbi:hypothetical protein ACNQFN_01760 [Thauera butanivorans]|uniref:hypothetical protein n=1 Tax=Thauera butanivorans TaxID=86174 RepID=UPI003AB59C3F